MSVKREVAEIVYATDPRRLSDTVKAGLLEPQSPGGVCAHPSVARLHADAIGTAPIASRGADTLSDGDRVMNSGKGMSGGPTSLSDVHP